MKKQQRHRITDKNIKNGIQIKRKTINYKRGAYINETTRVKAEFISNPKTIMAELP